MNSYICHSGGAEGADLGWELIGNEYNVKTIAYSFLNHKQFGKNLQILTTNELTEGYVAARKASLSINRPFDTIRSNYTKNLLARNWYQVKNSEAIFAIAKGFISETIVEGGTGWAVQMAIDNNKPVYVYDQSVNKWHIFNYEIRQFVAIDYIPTLTHNFAGIGTREITEEGINAIEKIYDKSLK